MGKVKRFVFVAAMSGILALAGCNIWPGSSETEDNPEGGETQPLKVAATLFPYYDFTRQIAGNMIDLELIVPAGMDSHSFEPTPADMKKIQEADVVICNGGAMEHWVGQVLDAVDQSGITVVTMMDYADAVEEERVEGMEEQSSHDHEKHGRSSVDNSEVFHDHDGYEDEIEYDEHIWTSPVHAVKFTEVIAQVLAEKDPDHQKEYQERKERYQDQLMELHQEFIQVADNRKRNLIVVGNKFPFRYLADEYGFEYRAAFTGCSTDTEPSARTIAYLIDKVREEQIPVVYYLELSSSRVAEIIGEETGARPLLLHSCHNVTRREFEQGITYVDLMKQNVENLRKGLDE